MELGDLSGELPGDHPGRTDKGYPGEGGLARRNSSPALEKGEEGPSFLPNTGPACSQGEAATPPTPVLLNELLPKTNLPSFLLKSPES